MDIRVMAGGDVMLGEHPAMVGRGVATRLCREASFDPFAGIRTLLAGADLALANLECALSDPSPFSRPSRRECRGPVCALSRLRDSGFHAFSLANNHIQQHGETAFRETHAMLEDAGLAVVGLAGDEPGRCRPVDLQRQGQTLRLLGYSLRPRQGFSQPPLYAEGTRDGILADIHEAGEDGAVAVVSIHWGDEFVHTPTREQVALGRTMAETGATLVLGHHPHVLQGWERRGRGAILYSLGNLVFDMPWLPALRRTALAECRLGDDGWADVVWHPLQLDEEHRPQQAGDQDERWIRSFLEEARQGLEAGTGPWPVLDGDDHALSVARAASEERWTRNRYFLRNLHRYRPDVSGELIGKFLLRRIGLLHD